MKASELKKVLQDMIDKHGDLKVKRFNLEGIDDDVEEVRVETVKEEFKPTETYFLIH